MRYVFCKFRYDDERDFLGAVNTLSHISTERAVEGEIRTAGKSTRILQVQFDTLRNTHVPPGEISSRTTRYQPDWP